MRNSSLVILLSSFVYRQMIRQRGWKCKFWRFVRRVLIKVFKDPSCNHVILDQPLVGPLSHELAFYLKILRNYDRLLRRIGSFYCKKRDGIFAIDVGANIGDTIACMYQGADTKVLAVEPNEKFNYYLKINWGNFENIEINTSLCSATDEQTNVSVNTKGGTASLERTSVEQRIEAKTLNTLFRESRLLDRLDFIKVDTDGFDFEVLKGAEELIQQFSPAVFIECDIFKNTQYIEDCDYAFSLFAKNGYEHCLVYDNYGSLMGKYDLKEFDVFLNLLFYQLTSSFYFFDILFIKDDFDEFFLNELHHYSQNQQDPAIKRANEVSLKRLAV